MDQEMTVEFLESWHARRAGWTFKHNSWWHEKLHGPICDHPIAPTIDAAVLALPGGCRYWTRLEDCYEVYAKGGYVHVQITGNTPAAIRRDLLALARLAWIAEGAEP